MSAALLGLVTTSCGDPLAPYPVELEGGHDVDGRHFCEYTIDGNYEVLLDYAPRIRLWGTSDEYNCDGDIYVSANPNPSGGICARVVTDNATTWIATVRARETPLGPDELPSFYSTSPGIWSLYDTTFDGTLTYDRVEGRLTLEVRGSGTAGPFSTHSGPGTVHCVYDATVE